MDSPAHLSPLPTKDEQQQQQPSGSGGGRGKRKTIQPFQYKSVLTVIRKAMHAVKEHGINITVLVECPRDDAPGASPSSRPLVLAASPVPNEQFAEYFRDVLTKGALALTRDDRYYSQNLNRRIEDARKRRHTEGVDAQVETMFVTPDIEPLTNAPNRKERAIVVTPYHLLANV